MLQPIPRFLRGSPVVRFLFEGGRIQRGSHEVDCRDGGQRQFSQGVEVSGCSRIGGSWWRLFFFGIGFRKEIKFMKENVSRIFAETFAQEDWKTCEYELGKEGVDFF